MAAACITEFYSCNKRMANEIGLADNTTVVAGTTYLNEEENCDDEKLIAPGAKLDTIVKGFSFTEGPAVDKHGNVFFTDQPNDKIYKWTVTSGQVSTFITGTGRSNGMAFDKDGNLITCADLHGEVWKIKPDGTHKVLVNNYNGKLLNGPNDVWINPKTGGMYIQILFFRGLIGKLATHVYNHGHLHILNRPQQAKVVMCITLLPAAIRW